MEASDEFFSHLFQFNVGGRMFEEEVALAELEIKEGAYFGIVAKGQEMAEQVEVVTLEVEARGGHAFERVGVIEGIVRVSLGGKTIVGVVGMMPKANVGDNVLQVSYAIACGSQGIVAEVRGLHIGIGGHDATSGLAIKVAWFGLVSVDECTISGIVGEVSVACLNGINVVGTENGWENIGHSIAWLGYIIETGIVHDTGRGTKSFAKGGVTQVFGAIGMRSEKIVFEAQAMADLMCCSVADQVKYQAVADVGAHFGIVGGCLQEKPRLEFQDNIGIEEYVGLQNLTGTWVNPMTAFSVGLLTINTEEGIAGKVEGIEVVAAFAEVIAFRRVGRPMV